MTFLFRLLLIPIVGLVLSACTPPKTHPADITAVARDVLGGIQRRSIRENREYCGSIARRSNGTLYATVPLQGGRASCPARPFYFAPSYRPGDELVANYHTHSAYGPFSDSEVPSGQDLDVTAIFEVPSYVSTPSGRFWYVRPEGDFTFQICGVGCLPSDPNFVPSTGRWAVPDQLTRKELAVRQP